MSVSVASTGPSSTVAPAGAPDTDSSAQGPDALETIIEPTRGWIGVNWGELVAGRELLLFLIWRDLKVRYKQAVLGAAWVVIQPLTAMMIYTLVFGKGAGLSKLLPGHDKEYDVFVYAALLPWQLFSSALNAGGMSLVNQQNIVQKIYFPRLYVPTAAVGGALVDMAISFVIVMILAAWEHVGISPMILLLPVMCLLALLNALGAAYLLSALTLKYRDFRFLLPLITQVLMFASFVAFPISLVGNSRWKLLLLFNPMYGAVSGFRRCILADFPSDMIGFQWKYILASFIGGAIVFFIGIMVFRRTERSFADIA